MLSFISWEQYLLAITTAGFLYYLVVFLTFYRRYVTSSVFTERHPQKRPRTAILGEAKPDHNEPISISDLEFNNGNEDQEQHNQN